MKFPPVQPFPDAFARVLCVVAHPDDVEYGTSSAVASWTAKGIEVAYLLLTRGEAGIDTMDPTATAELRIREQIKGSHEVGVTQVDFLEYPDGVLEYSIAMRRDIARAIRSFRPDALVVTAWDVEFPFGLNQADHRVAGLAAVDAMRDAANRWVFPELLDGGLEPHSTRWLITNGFENATHGVDISGEPLERGIASLEAHAEYLAAIPGHPAPRDMISGVHCVTGQGDGCRKCRAVSSMGFPSPSSPLGGIRGSSRTTGICGGLVSSLFSALNQGNPVRESQQGVLPVAA
jgi:LmbE family N-acetylglucosaminyl deacetylase